MWLTPSRANTNARRLQHLPKILFFEADGLHIHVCKANQKGAVKYKNTGSNYYRFLKEKIVSNQNLAKPHYPLTVI